MEFKKSKITGNILFPVIIIYCIACVAVEAFISSNVFHGLVLFAFSIPIYATVP